MYKMKFGKHKGKELKDVEAQYLMWLYNNVNIDAELREYIESNKTELQKKAAAEHAAFMYEYCDGEVCAPH